MRIRYPAPKAVMSALAEHTGEVAGLAHVDDL
jgi:hypothetical protein